MLKYFAAIFILASGFCAAPPHRAPTPTPSPAVPQIDVEAERYAIYSLFLKKIVADKSVKLLVVENHTRADTYSEDEWTGMKVEPNWQSVIDLDAGSGSVFWRRRRIVESLFTRSIQRHRAWSRFQM